MILFYILSSQILKSNQNIMTYIIITPVHKNSLLKLSNCNASQLALE